MSAITILDIALLTAVLATTVAVWRQRSTAGPVSAKTLGWPLSIGLGCLAAVAVIALFATQTSTSALQGASALAVSGGLANLVFRTLLAAAVVALCFAMLGVTASAARALATLKAGAKDHRHDDHRLRAMLDLGADWVWETDLNGRITYSNDRGLELLGYSRQEALGKDWLELCHPDEANEAGELMQGLLLRGQGWSRRTFRVRDRRGKYRFLESSAKPLLDEEGRVRGCIGVERDTTEQRLLEFALGEALAEAERRDNEDRGAPPAEPELRRTDDFASIIGGSDALRECLDLVARAGPTDVPVLILGETGTGKELIAQALHQVSRRSGAAMVSLNCATLPPSLVEVELFGHEKGAFTGAEGQRKGLFELADGGTIFLDEIGELPPPLQSKLLRVLEDGSFSRVGGNETIRVDVRLISATNIDFDSAVKSGTFRADLSFRINTVTIRIPPLRERQEDIAALAQHFVAKHGPKLNPQVESISAELLRQMQRREWPGNVRELENFIERCLVAAQSPVLRTMDSEIWQPGATDSGEGVAAGASSLPADVADFERQHIEKVLDACKWVIDGPNGAAAMLGVPPSTLRYKMKKLGVARE